MYWNKSQFAMLGVWGGGGTLAKHAPLCVVAAGRLELLLLSVRCLCLKQRPSVLLNSPL